MKNLLFLLLIIILIGCDSVEPNKNYRELAHGYWLTKSGDTNVTGEIGLISYNWYAINTIKDDELVFIMWDDGISCQETEARIYDDIIVMKVNNIDCEFKIEDSEHITAKFKTNEKTYTKYLKKEREDPSVLCD